MTNPPAFRRTSVWAAALALLFALCAPPGLVLANGGPIDGSAVKQTGNVNLVGAPEVNLLAEDLTIVLDGDLARVEIRYLFRNQGEDADVDFGFPLQVSEMEREFEQDPSLQSYALWDGDTELVWEEAPMREAAPMPQCVMDMVEQWPDIIGFSDDQDVERMWLVSSVHFPGHADKELTISYIVKVNFVDAAFSKSFLPSYSTRVFMYDFSPASNWGDGRIGDLNVRVDFSANQARGMELLGLVPDMEDMDGGVYAMHREDFEVNDLCNLTLAYDAEDWKLSQFIQSQRIQAENVTLTASSFQAGYPPENLLDNDPATAWVPEGDGVGSSLRVEVRGYRILGAVLLNGYAKSATLYLANSRASSLDLDKEVMDWDGNTSHESSTVELPDLPFDLFNAESFFGLAQVVADMGDGYMTMSGLTFTVTGVYPGSAYQDLCLSELYLVGWPEVEHPDSE